jgi:hypothetical protein
VVAAQSLLSFVLARYSIVTLVGQNRYSRWPDSLLSFARFVTLVGLGVETHGAYTHSPVVPQTCFLSSYGMPSTGRLAESTLHMFEPVQLELRLR